MDRFKIIKNFLSKEEVSLFKIWSDIMHRKNLDNFDQDRNQPNKDTRFYGTAATDALLIKNISCVSENTGFKLLPSYSYGRVYTKFAHLKKHVDRPSCEISVTIQIGSDGTPWPIFMGEEKVLLKEGDAVLYKGTEVTHWREEFQGDWHSQIFLHYVKADGKYKEYYIDKRKLFGTTK